MDDYLFDKYSLELIVRTMEKENGMWLCSSYVHTQDRINFVNQLIPKWNEKILEGINTLGCPSGLTISKNVKERFDTNLKWFMDCDFYRNLKKTYGEPKYLNEIIVVNYIHKEQVSNECLSNLNIENSEREYLKKKYL